MDEPNPSFKRRVVRKFGTLMKVQFVVIGSFPKKEIGRKAGVEGVLPKNETSSASASLVTDFNNARQLLGFLGKSFGRRRRR